MDAIDKDSIYLHYLCCNMGLTSNQRKRNVQFADCVTTLGATSDKGFRTILCGSRSEGAYPFNLISPLLKQSSDADYLITLGTNVQEHVDTPNTKNAEALQMLHTDSPEQVLLQVSLEQILLEIKYLESDCKPFNNTSLHLIRYALRVKHNMILVSSRVVKERAKDEIKQICSMAVTSMDINGPAVMTEQIGLSWTKSTDNVMCFLCKEWPTAANEWIDRARQHGWPSKNLIDQIVNDGCELVPVGSKKHPDEDVQWKLSFSRAETRLIRNFNIYQAQCYQLLKIVKHHFISSVVVDSLSSYHIKTVMLHTVEQTDQKVWRKDNLTQCFMMCLSNLKRYLTDMFLPQYFIVKQNLLEPKVTGDVHQKVLDIVTDLDKIGWKCMLQVPLLQEMYRNIQKTFDRMSYTRFNHIFGLDGNEGAVSTSRIPMEYEANQEQLNIIFVVLLNQLVKISPFSPSSYYCYLVKSVVFSEKRFLRSTTIHPSVETIRVIQLALKSQLGLLLTVTWAMAHPDLRPGIDRLMKFARQCLEESCHADVSCGRLKLATFYFHLGEYQKCIATVQNVLERFKDVWVVAPGPGIRNDVDCMSIPELKYNQVLQLSNNGFPFISKHLSLPISFMRWEVAVAPKGVQFLKNQRHKEDDLSPECCIDSIVYAHYLLLESYLKINEHDHADQALIKMKECIRNGKHDVFDRNCLCCCEDDNVLLQYSDRLMANNDTVKSTSQKSHKENMASSDDDIGNRSAKGSRSPVSKGDSDTEKQPKKRSRLLDCDSDHDDKDVPLIGCLSKTNEESSVVMQMCLYL